ncbi:hypothetical protein SDC9_114164 [bioreactor metagenome]|uniref:NAD-specific glutamate dehydrogenase n=1 Tax=bioreactor metagenome TaxID=1076179 RepID=A0A645BVK9_9ZZZZ
MHGSVGQVQLSLGHQGVHHGLLVASLQAELHFALQVGADIATQAVHGAVGNAERLGELLVHFGQVSGFDLLDCHQEVSGLAGHFLAMVVLRESQRESLAFASLQTAHGVFEFLEHLAFADQELELFSLAASEGFAVDLAFKVHGHAVAVFGTGILGALSEGAALLAQDVQRLVDGGVGHFGSNLLHFGGSQITDLHFGEHFEHGVERHFAFGSAFLFGNAGLTGNAQVGFVGGLGKRLTHLVVHHFVVNGITIALAHHAQRHLARTEAVHLHGAGQALQARFDFALNRGNGQAQRDFALELFKIFNSYGHGSS